ncbi:MAG TPA: hypothetical protein VGI39_15555 [Polyangiaceae bacterium]|jgi:hypothetical protein
MRLSILITTGLFLGLGAAGCSSESTGAGTTAAPSATAEVALHAPALPHAAVASDALDTLASLVAQGNPESRGFHSVAEVRTATLSTALPMYRVGLEPLRAYHAGADTRALLEDEGAVMYPVAVSGDVRSAIVVKKRPSGDWEASSFGHAKLAQKAHAGRKGVAAARGVAEADVALVEVPTLSASFLSHEEAGRTMLTPLHDVAGTDLKAGATVAASEVFAKLQPLAAQHDGNVPN